MLKKLIINTQENLKSFYSGKGSKTDDAVEVMNKIKKLSKHESYCNLLTYSLLLEDGIILHKDGALSMSYTYIGPDIESETDGSVDGLSAKIIHSLSQLEEGWMYETNLISSIAPGYSKTDNFRDVVSEIIDVEREYLFQTDEMVYKTETVITFSYNQTNEQIERLKNFSIDRPDIENASGLREMLYKFKQSVEAITSLMGAYNIHCNRLTDSETLSYLFNCINIKNEKITGAKYNMFLDSFLVEQDMRPGMDIMIGNKHVSVLSLDDMPSEHYPTILDELSQLRAEFRWSTRFTPLPFEEASRIFKRKVNDWDAKEVGLSGILSQLMGKYDHKRDKHAQEMKAQTEHAQMRQSAGDLFGYMNSTIIVYHEDPRRVEETVALITKTIKTKGFSKVRLETLNATEAFLGSLPSHGGYNPRKIPVSIEFVADLFPTTGIYQGQPYAPNPSIGHDKPPLLETMTRGSRKFSFNLHHNDVAHTGIYGPTGTGKSILLSMMMAAWFRKYAGVRVIGSDYNYGLLGTTLALNGSYIDILSDDIKLSPFIGVDDENYRKGFLNRWLLNVLELTSNEKSTSKQKTALIEALERLAGMSENDHNFTRFIAQLDDDEMQVTFKTFVQGVPNDVLSGNSKDDVFTGDLVLFEKKNILELSKHLKVPILEYIYFKQRKMVQDNPGPTIMIIDEASFEMSDPILSPYFMDTLKTGRHNDIGLVFATQSPEDIHLLGSPSRVQDNLRTQIFLPNQKALHDKIVNQVYLNVGMNEQEIQLIANAVPKREYYVKQTLGNKLMRLDVGPVALAFIGMTIRDKEKLEEMKATMDLNDPGWALEWLKKCGLNDEAKALENLDCFKGEVIA
jgi:type IV secretory pathway VirB4 component|tara:strand:- start:36651 stop:39203 length:2553 start_codon:yes stop_codon:yes gene_type:complete